MVPAVLKAGLMAQTSASWIIGGSFVVCPGVPETPSNYRVEYLEALLAESHCSQELIPLGHIWWQGNGPEARLICWASRLPDVRLNSISLG